MAKFNTDNLRLTDDPKELESTSAHFTHEPKQHSPAPWRWEHNEYEYPNMPALIDQFGNTVMDLGDDTEYYPTQGTAPNPADAALIAAAPEMLELLHGLRSLTSDLAPYWQQKVIDVISKAEGNVPAKTETE